MKSLKLLLCSSFFVLVFSYSSGQSWYWGKDGYGSLFTNFYGCEVATDRNGNAYTTGQYYSSIIFDADTLSSIGESAFLIKYNSSGNVVWARQGIDSTGANSFGTSVATDKWGNIFITGIFSGTVQFGSVSLRSTYFNVYIVKYDANGNVLWAKQGTELSRYGYGFGYSVAADANGNAFITGFGSDTLSFGTYTLSSSVSDNTFIFLAKYDSSGNVLWAKQSISTSVRTSSGGNGYSVSTDKSGNVLVTGYFYDTVSFGATSLVGPRYSVFVVKYSPSGNVIWAKQSENGSANSYAWGYSITTDKAENAYITGYFTDTVSFGSYTFYSPGTRCLYLTKYDTNGNILWAKQTSPGHTGLSLASDTMNHIYLSGVNYTSDTLFFGSFKLYSNFGITDSTFLLKLDTSGNATCGSLLNTLGQNDIACDSTGTYVYLASSFINTLISGTDTLALPATDEGVFTGRWEDCNGTIGINELKTKSEELTVYPNPFSTTTTVFLSSQYSLPKTYYLELDDITGRKLRYIEFEGSQYELSADGLAKGLYFVRVFGWSLTGDYTNCIGTTKIVVQ